MAGKTYINNRDNDLSEGLKQLASYLNIQRVSFKHSRVSVSCDVTIKDKSYIIHLISPPMCICY